MSNDKMNLKIELMFSSSFGENLYVVGNIPELGTWIPDEGVLLKYKNSMSWKGLVQIERKKIAIEYKFVLKDFNSGNVIWEDGENRRLEITEEILLRDEISLSHAWNGKLAERLYENGELPDPLHPKPHQYLC